jgi:hypothetical protein
MGDSSDARLEEMAKRVYGDEIAYFARGSAELEKQAIRVSIPAMAALTLSEEYASIVLTSRMDNELQKFLQRALHKQGDAEELLFEFNMPFGTFSAKIAAAYSFGFLTQKMYDALTCCRKIRNAYAHSDNPDEAKTSKDYTKYVPRLLRLDPEHTAECVAKLQDLHIRCMGLITVLQKVSDVIAVMLKICDTLGAAAFTAGGAADQRPHAIPAPFGAQDMLDVTLKRAARCQEP